MTIYFFLEIFGGNVPLGSPGYGYAPVVEVSLTLSFLLTITLY